MGNPWRVRFWLTDAASAWKVGVYAWSPHRATTYPRSLCVRWARCVYVHCKQSSVVTSCNSRAEEWRKERTRVKPLKTLLSFFSGFSFVVHVRLIASEWKLCAAFAHTQRSHSRAHNERNASRLGHNAECIAFTNSSAGSGQKKIVQKVNKIRWRLTRDSAIIYLCAAVLVRSMKLFCIFCRFSRGTFDHKIETKWNETSTWACFSLAPIRESDVDCRLIK